VRGITDPPPAQLLSINSLMYLYNLFLIANLIFIFAMFGLFLGTSEQYSLLWRSEKPKVNLHGVSYTARQRELGAQCHRITNNGSSVSPVSEPEYPSKRVFPKTGQSTVNKEVMLEASVGSHHLSPEGRRKSSILTRTLNMHKSSGLTGGTPFYFLIFICLEVAFLSVFIIFLTCSFLYDSIQGSVMGLFLLVLLAADSAIALALVLRHAEPSSVGFHRTVNSQ